MRRWVSVGVLVLWGWSTEAHATWSAPKPSPTNACYHLAQALGDPLLEFDRDRCRWAREKLAGRSPDPVAQAELAVCRATSVGASSDEIDPATCNQTVAEMESKWSFEASQGFHGAAVAGAQLLKGHEDQRQTRCQFLATALDQPTWAKDLNLCRGGERRLYLRDPARSTELYRSFCLAVTGDNASGLPLPELLRVCPFFYRQHAEFVVPTTPAPTLGGAAPAATAGAADKKPASSGATAAAGPKKSDRSAEAQRQAAAEAARAKQQRNGVIGLAVIGLLAGLWIYVKFLHKRVRRWVRRKLRLRQLERRGPQAIAFAGATPEEREEVLRKGFDSGELPLSYVEDKYRDDEDGWLRFELLRDLRTMHPREQIGLRIGYLLYNRGLISAVRFDTIRFGLLYGDGRAQLVSMKAKRFLGENAPDALKLCAQRQAISVDGSINLANRALLEASRRAPDLDVIKHLNRLMRGDGFWLTTPEIPQTIFADEAPVDAHGGLRLYLGNMLDEPNSALSFSKNGAILTIAPPGSGKTQCHVLPNLVYWNGAALVLDVKGEIYPATKEWREKFVGPVYRFAPLDPENSAHFNPLTFVRGDRMNVWEDARLLADLIHVPTSGASGDGKYWDQSARDLLAAIIAERCYGIPPEQRSMDDVYEIASRIGWNDFVASLQVSDIKAMKGVGSKLEHIEPKTLDGYLQTLSGSLEPWIGERVRMITDRSDWSLADLRSEARPTIYMCLHGDEMDSFSSLLRVFAGMHLRALTTGEAKREARPVLFMLDEMPQLKRLPLIEKALELGRGYGVRLWMFAQSVGQIHAVYGKETGDGMIGMCAVQCYMNPSLRDGTAQYVSEVLGKHVDAMSGERRTSVDPATLAGPEFKDDIIVIGQGAKPARVRKVMAHATPFFRDRMPRS